MGARLLKGWILWLLLLLVVLEVLVARIVPFVSYLIFPTVGAFIGYMTNMLAIWMIFNPKRPVNLLLFKWQGLVPKSRDRIAENLATTVERELVNAQLIKEYLTEDKRKREIKDSPVEFVLGELDRDYPSLKELLGANYPRLRQFILDYYINNHTAVIRFLDRVMRGIVEKPLGEFLDENRYRRIRRWLEEYSGKMIHEFSQKTVGEVFGNRDIEEMVARLLDRIDDRALSSLYNAFRNKSIYDIYPRSVEISDRLIEAFADKLRDPEFRRRLSRLIIEAVKERSNLLIQLGIEIAKFFLDLESKVSEYIENLANRIETDSTIIEDVKKEVERFLKNPISRYIDEKQFVEALGRMVQFVRQDVISLAGNLSRMRISEVVSPRLVDSLRQKAMEWMDGAYERNRDKPVLRDLYERYAGEVEEVLARILTSPQVERVIGESLDRLSAKPIGNPRRRLEEYIDVRRFIEDFIDAIFDRIVDVIEGLVEKIDVRSIVLERIMGYSVDEMEELVFGMMKREFRTIELLGIPIGFAVGLIQVLLRILGI